MRSISNEDPRVVKAPLFPALRAAVARARPAERPQRRNRKTAHLACLLLPLLAGPSLRAESTSFPAGSLIIPMDTGANSQDAGMLRAYGLVYQLLRHEIPVHWVIEPAKPANGNDFTIQGTPGTQLRDLESGAALTFPRAYRGGPFVITAAHSAAALPLVEAWQSAAGDATVVHRLTAGAFEAPVSRRLLRAPAVAVLKDGNEQIVFDNFNEAGIRDSTGAAWGPASPGLLTEEEVAGPGPDAGDGALFLGPGQARYGFLAVMHYAPTALSGQVVREVRAWLTSRPLTHVFMQCEAIATFEDDPSGRFLTTAGLGLDPEPLAPVVNHPGHPLAQLDGPFGTDSGSVSALRLGTGSFRAGATTVINGESNLTRQIILLSGPMDGLTANGQVTYLGGHDYSLELPASTNPQTGGIRVFLNSLLAAGAAMELSPSFANLFKTATGFEFHLTGSPGSVYRIQTSANLRDWTNWQTVNNPGGSVRVIDSPLPAGDTRFYRALLAPAD